MVEANIIEASDRQHRTYGNCEDKTLIVGQHVLLSNPWKAGPPMDRPLDNYRTQGPNNHHYTDGESSKNSTC